MSSRWFRMFTWGIVCIWVVLLSVLLYRHYVSGVALSATRNISSDSFKLTDQWFALFQNKEHIGHMHFKIHQVGEEYRFSQDVETRHQENGEAVTVRSHLRCLSDAAARIKTFDFETDAGGSVFKSHGEFDEGVLVMFMEKDGEHRAVNREIKERPYFPLTVKIALFDRGLQKGMKVRLPILDFLTLNVIEAVAEVEEIVPVKAGIHVVSAYQVSVKYPGSDKRFWITEAGLTLREELPQGILALYDNEETVTAERAWNTVYDYLMIPAVESNLLISEPAKVKRLKVRLSGIDPDDFPDLDGSYQRLTGDTVEVVKYGEKELEPFGYEIPYGDDDLKHYLETTPWVQSDDPKILDFAKVVRVRLTDVADVVGAYVGRVYAWIRAQPTTRIPTAVEAKETRIGECLEHTVLMTGMARASGIPARMAAGLVPIRGFFYYHTWPEVWIGQWVAVDSTRAEWPAGAARIRFVTGDMEDLVAFSKKVGEIKVEVLEVL